MILEIVLGCTTIAGFSIAWHFKKMSSAYRSAWLDSVKTAQEILSTSGHLSTKLNAIHASIKSVEMKAGTMKGAIKRMNEKI